MNAAIYFSILIVLALSSSEAKQLKWIAVCPDCVYRPEDTFAQYALRYLNGNGPANGTCLKGVKWIHHGKDYGLPNDACCCLMLPPAEDIDCGPDNFSPLCPISPLMGPDEPIKHFWQRIGKLLKVAPTNGCCPEGTFRWVFSKEMTDAEADICACGSSNGITDPNVDWRDESSSSSTSSSEEK